MRELTRVRETAMNDLRAKRQQISAFLLRRGVHYPPDKKTCRLGRVLVQQLIDPAAIFPSRLFSR